MISNSKRFQVSFGSNFHWVEGFSKFILFMHMHMQYHDKMPVLYVPHQKNILPNIDDVHIVGDKSHSSRSRF
jgi:hypothetical protein